MGIGVDSIKEPEKSGLFSVAGGLTWTNSYPHSKCEAFKGALCGSMRSQEIPLVNIKMKAWQEAGDLGWERKRSLSDS